MRRILFGILACLALSAGARAGTYSPSTCSYADVNAAINNTIPGTGGSPQHLAVAGDVILWPAGTCTWTSVLTITVNITIMGNGTPNTLPTQYGAGTINTIIVTNIPNTPIVVQIPYSAGALFRMSTIDFEAINTTTHVGNPLSVVGTCTTTSCPNIRLDNLGFGLITPYTDTNIPTDALVTLDDVFGVFDHNTVPSGNYGHNIDIEHSNYLGTTETNCEGAGCGDNSWAQPDSMGTLNAFYVENNILNTQLLIADNEFYANGGGGVGGAREVFRFNQLAIVTANQPSGMIGGHGLDTDGRPRSIRHVEFYGNTAACNAASFSCGAPVQTRGGTMKVFGNTLTRSGSALWKGAAATALYRAVYGDPTSWSYCGGGTAYDNNDVNSINGGSNNTGFVYYSGTMATSGSGVVTFTDSSQSWTTNQFVPAGAPYSVHDVTQGFWAEITSNTATTVTVLPGIGTPPEFNNGDTYQITRAFVCADQGGRGIGVPITGTTPTPVSRVLEALDPMYEWDDIYSPGFTGLNFAAASTTRLVNNRDWYTDASGGSPAVQTSPTSPFNGTSGVGFGTLANRPSTCTNGVGYWATDQGSWNTSSNTYAGGFSQGQLSTCTPTLDVDLVYAGNASTVGTALTPAIGEASTVSNNCVPVSCAQWGTPTVASTYFVGANQPSCNNLNPVAVNGGGPTYAAGALNHNNIQFDNTFAYWSLYLSTIPASVNNMTAGVCATPLPNVGSEAIDMFFIQDTDGNKAWAQEYNDGNGNLAFHIESALLAGGGGSSAPAITPGNSAFPGPFLVSMNYNESQAGLGFTGNYSSGGTVTGSAGKICNVTFTGGTGFVTLQGTNSLAGAIVSGVATAGTPWVSAPTSGTLSNGPANSGPATCSGTISITGTALTGAATLSVHNAITGILYGQVQVAVGLSTNPQLANIQIGNGENFSGSVNWYYQNLMMTWTGTVPQDMYATPPTGTWATSYTPETYPHPLATPSTPQAGTPTFSPVAGSYPATQTVTITSSPSTVICWNTTGAPQTNGASGCTTGTLYSGAIGVSSSETIFAVGGGTGYLDSNIASASYTIGTPPAAGIMTSKTKIVTGTTIR